MTAKIYVIHENDEWLVPLRAAFEKISAPYEEWFLDEGCIPFSEDAPEGVFFNRMSASSHTRGHRWGPEYTANLLAWLERDEATIVNGSNAIRLEVSKVTQYAALETVGVQVPQTYAVIGKKDLLTTAQKFNGKAFITKHNRAGKGLGVQLFKTSEALQSYLESDDYDEPIDGITLLQEYIEAPEPFITRVEFVGGRFIYAVKVDTSEGFQLCPADACQIGDAFCPTKKEDKKEKFQVLSNFTETLENRELIQKYEQVLKENDVQVAGIEFIRDKEGQIYTYDINTNTNYNQKAEQRAGLEKGGMDHVAEHLMALLANAK